MSQLVRVDEDIAEGPDGALVLAVGLEDLGGPFDFLVVAREGLLDEFYHLLCAQIVEIDV